MIPYPFKVVSTQEGGVLFVGEFDQLFYCFLHGRFVTVLIVGLCVTEEKNINCRQYISETCIHLIWFGLKSAKQSAASGPFPRPKQILPGPDDMLLECKSTNSSAPSCFKHNKPQRRVILLLVHVWKRLWKEKGFKAV